MCDTFVALDLEMTGLKVRTDRILEIGGLSVENGTVTDMFQPFVNPHRKLDEKIVKLTGINQDMISDAPEAEEALAEAAGSASPSDAHPCISSAENRISSSTMPHTKGLRTCNFPFITTHPYSRRRGRR